MTKEEIAELIGKSPATVFRRAKKENWKVVEKKENKARKHYYDVEHLIKHKIIDVKEKIIKEVKEKEEKTEINKELDELPEWNQDLALGKFYVCKQVEKIIHETTMSRMDAIEYIAENFSSFEILQMIKKDKLSRNTLYKWYRIYEENRNNPVALASNYGKTKGKTKLTEEEQEFIKSLYFSKNKVSVMYVYERYYAKYTKKAKSYHVVLNYINRIPKTVRDKYRMGKKEFKDTYEPFVLRDNHDIKANEVWVSDGHDLELMVKLRERDDKGKPKIVTPKWIVWQDMKTKVIVGWSLSMTENSEAIVDALRMGIKKYGKPKSLFTDNGRAYKSKLLKGDEAAKLEGIYGRLGLEVQHALPYNAQSKPLERAFRDFKETFAKEFNSYKGGSIFEKPEKLKEVLKEGNIVEYEMLHEMLEKYVEYRNGPYYMIRGGHRGKGVNGVPIEIMNQENPPESREKITDAELRILLHHEQLRTVRQEGIELYGNLYHSPAMYQYIGEKVIVRYDPEDLATLYVYDDEKAFLFKVEARRLAGFKDINSLKELKRLKRTYKKQLKKSDTTLRVINEKDPELKLLSKTEQSDLEILDFIEDEDIIVNEAIEEELIDKTEADDEEIVVFEKTFEELEEI